MDSQALVLTDISQSTGVITLNRPKALNSLNPEMIAELSRTLRAWREDEKVEQIVIESASPKGFCAGGDVRFAREEVLAGNLEETDEFFAEEYAMNSMLASYPKPIVALVGGVVMGGGLGVSALGSHLVVADKAFASMPEMAIGFSTDVGMTQHFQTMQGTRGKASPALGRFLALTGWRLNPSEMIWTGLASNYVGDTDLDEVRDAIIDGGVSALDGLSRTPDEADNRLLGLIDDIEEVFAHDEWAQIAEALPQHRELEEQVGELTAEANPASLVATTLLCARTAKVDIDEALELERRVGDVLRREPNFAEGVRAVLVDKDHEAKFVPPTTSAVDDTPYREALA